MTARLVGKRALVTGAGSGIGRAIATALAADGAAVAVLDRDEPAARTAAAEASANAGTAFGLDADVTDESSVAAAVQRAARQLGGLDVAVVCAGIQLFGEDSPVHELSLDAWQRTVDVNLTGAFLTCKHVVPPILAAGGGSVVVVGSPTGMYGTAPGFTAYSASKAGLLGLVRVMAVDYAPRGLRTNLVLPGFTSTPLVQSVLDDPAQLRDATRHIPLGRPGTPEEVGGLVAYLVSDAASYATGGVFTMDGGLTAV